MRLKFPWEYKKPTNRGEVLEREGKFYMRFDKKNEGAEIPANIAQIIRVALLTERRLTRGRNKKTLSIRQKINCHQAALYSIGLIDGKELKYDGNFDFRLLERDDFRKFNKSEDLSRYIRGKTGNSVGLVQVAHDVGETALVGKSHSFIVSFDSDGRAVCFEKEGYSYDYQFQIVSLDSIYKGYRNCLWSAGPIDDVEKSNKAKNIRQTLATVKRG